MKLFLIITSGFKIIWTESNKCRKSYSLKSTFQPSCCVKTLFCNVWILIDNILSPDATTRNIIKQLMFFKNSKIIHISFSYFQRTVVILNAKVLNVPNFFVDLYLGPNPSRPTLSHETKQKFSVGIYPEPTGT